MAGKFLSPQVSRRLGGGGSRVPCPLVPLAVAVQSHRGVLMRPSILFTHLRGLSSVPGGPGLVSPLALHMGRSVLTSESVLIPVCPGVRWPAKLSPCATPVSVCRPAGPLQAVCPQTSVPTSGPGLRVPMFPLGLPLLTESSGLLVICSQCGLPCLLSVLSRPRTHHRPLCLCVLALFPCLGCLLRLVTCERGNTVVCLYCWVMMRIR